MVMAVFLLAGAYRLNGQGVLEARQARVQVLNLPRLLGQQQMFYSAKPCLHLGAKRLKILLGGQLCWGHLVASPLPLRSGGELDLQLFEGRLIRRPGDR
jgi:hypothetical protein